MQCAIQIVCIIAKVCAWFATTLSTGERLMEIGKEIRKFLHDLLGSRYSEHMEIELLRLRQDFDVRIQEYKNSIADLRAEKSLLYAKCMLYETNINARVGIDPTRKNPEKPSFANFSSPPMV